MVNLFVAEYQAGYNAILDQGDPRGKGYWANVKKYGPNNVVLFDDKKFVPYSPWHDGNETHQSVEYLKGNTPELKEILQALGQTNLSYGNNDHVLVRSELHIYSTYHEELDAIEAWVEKGVTAEQAKQICFDKILQQYNPNDYRLKFIIRKDQQDWSLF